MNFRVASMIKVDVGRVCVRPLTKFGMRIGKGTKLIDVAGLATRIRDGGEVRICAVVFLMTNAAGQIVLKRGRPADRLNSQAVVGKL